jgi:hypothetical protein
MYWHSFILITKIARNRLVRIELEHMIKTLQQSNSERTRESLAGKMAEHSSVLIISQKKINSSVNMNIRKDILKRKYVCIA